MKTKKITLIFFIVIFAINANSQNEYVLTGDYKNALQNVYEVQRKTIQTHRYEYKEIDNPKYLSLTNSIDSIKKIGKIILPLENAKKYLTYSLNNKPKSSSIDDAIAFRKERWDPLITAKIDLDRSDFSFEQNVEGKYKVAIEQAKNNINKIDKLLLNYKSLSELKDEISELKKYSIKAKIFDYVPMEEIKREILYIDTTINITTLGEILIPSKETYKFILKDFNGAVAGEVMSTNISKEFFSNPQNKRAVLGSIYEYTGKSFVSGNVFFIDKASGKLYCSDNGFWNRYTMEKETYEALSFLEKSGGKYYEEGGKYKYKGTTYVEYKGHKCILDRIIMEALINKDITVISKMSSSVAQHKKLKDQASVLADEIAKYYSANIRLLSSAQITAWKSATIKCDNLIKKMWKLPYASERVYYNQIREEDNQGNKLSTIIDMTNLSKSKLGL